MGPSSSPYPPPLTLGPLLLGQHVGQVRAVAGKHRHVGNRGERPQRLQPPPEPRHESEKRTACALLLLQLCGQGLADSGIQQLEELLALLGSQGACRVRKCGSVGR